MHRDIWQSPYPEGYGTPIEWGTESGLYEFLRRPVSGRQFSDRPAVSCVGTTLLYRDLWHSVDRLADFLVREWGIVKGDRVAIMLPNSIQFVVGFLACAKIGAIISPVNPLYTARELEHQLQDSGAKGILVLDFFQGVLDECVKQTQIEYVMSVSLSDYMPFWKKPIFFAIMKREGKVVPTDVSYSFDTYSAVVGKSSPSNPVRSSVDISLTDTLMLQYTGGTTGRSKGVELTHQNLIANIKQLQNVVQSSVRPGRETMLAALPLYHIFALNAAFLLMIRQRAHIALLPKPTPLDKTIKGIQEYRPTMFVGINTLFNGLNQREDFQKLKDYPFRCVVAGGMTLQSEVAKEWYRITGSEIREGYGLTEASPVTHCNLFELPAKAQSIGLPLASTQAKVMDQKGQEVTPGEKGELWVKGPQVMKGYWNNPEATEEVLIDGWLRTGDIAVMDEQGWFSIVDRKKDMIIVSGFNVYPTEIEEILVQHPDISEAAVIGVHHKKSGETVKAFLVAKPGKTIDLTSVQQHCEKLLTRYKLPKEWEIRTELPKSPVGKILRKELRKENPEI